MKQSDNEKMRKFKNRCKNTLQRVAKFCRQHIFPVVLALCVLVGVIFGLYYKAYATGMTELYMTYWDLYNSIFASTGYSMKIKDGAEDYNNANRVTGKQAWHNFCEYVKIHASDVYDEAIALPKFVTVQGIKMSQDLWKAAQDYAATFSASDSTNNYQLSDSYDLLPVLNSVLPFPCSFKSFPINTREYSYIIYAVMKGSDYRAVYIQSMKRSSDGDVLDHASIEDGVIHLYTRYGKTTPSEVGNAWYTTSDGTSGYNFHSVYSYEQVSGYSGCHTVTLWRDGVKVKDDEPPIITDPARQLPEKVREDEYIPWLTWADLDVKMREATNDNEDESHKDDDNDDNDKDKNGKSWKDIIPALIPYNPGMVVPTQTQKDSQKDSQKDDTTNATDPSDIPPIAEKSGNWKRLFPFCIPWDMMALVNSLKADKKAPRFTFKYHFEKIDYTWVVDVNMQDYWKYIKIFRWGMTIFFIIGLFFLTVKFTTFVYKMGG